MLETFHDILPIRNKSQTKINLINQDTNKEISEAGTADFINTFFANIGPTIARKVDSRPANSWNKTYIGILC